MRCYIEVRPAVVAEVSGHSGHRVGPRCLRNAGLLGDIPESSIALVSVEVVAWHRQPSGSTVDCNTFEVAERVCAGLWQSLEMQVDLVGDVEIQVPIPIIIKKRASRSPASITFVDQPGLLSNVGKCAIAVVTVKDILPVISDEDVFKTVVVIVSDGYSAGPPGTH